MKTITRSLILGSSMLALAACGPDEISSPGGGGIVINNPAPTPTPGPNPGPTPTPTDVTAAESCPDVAGITDSFVVDVPQGTVRVCTLPARFTASTTLPYVSGVAYRMNGRVDVGEDGGPVASADDTDVTLTIEPGVTIYAGTGVSWLAVNRGNRIDAQGTASNPIIFTSEQNVLGTATEDSIGQWGGVVLLGRAPITDCDAGGAEPGTIECERDTEGASSPAMYGGATEDDSSGIMRYVQIRYSGYSLAEGNELQSLTLGGVGSGTELDHIMSFNSSDDALEAFGGVVNAKHLVFVGADDDNLDTDTGVKANFQYVLAVQRDGAGDTMIEADSTNEGHDETPRQNTIVSNATFVHRAPAASAVMRLRGGTDYTLVNSIIHAPDANCLRVDDTETLQTEGADEAGAPVFHSVVMTCAEAFIDGSGGVSAADAQAAFDAGANNNASFTSTLMMDFINGSNEGGVSAFDATTLSAFFDSVDYIGAVREGDSWYQGWTCNSVAADLGGGSDCAASPVT